MEGFVSLNQRLISQELEHAFTRDYVGSDSGTIKNVYRGSPYIARNGLKVIGCSSLRGVGGELGTNKNLDLWL